METVAIAILNFNGKNHLAQFLPSVVKNSNPAKIYVIDNASSDDSVSFIETNYPNIEIITNEINSVLQVAITKVWPQLQKIWLFF